MTYSDWLATVQSTSAPERKAQIFILCGENRLGEQLTTFCELLGDCYKQALSNGKIGLDAGLSALDEAIKSLYPPNSKWLGLLPMPKTTLPNTMVSHLPARDINRYFPSAPIDEDNPPAVIKLGKAYKFPHARFIWVTFEPNSDPLSNDPTKVVRELGLSHYIGHKYIFRLELNISGLQLYIPSCLDCGLFPAWAPPAAGVPWGQTRDLSTGEHRKPELLTESSDHATTLLTARLVSPPGQRRQIEPIVVDYMIGR